MSGYNGLIDISAEYMYTIHAHVTGDYPDGNPNYLYNRKGYFGETPE